MTTAKKYEGLDNTIIEELSAYNGNSLTMKKLMEISTKRTKLPTDNRLTRLSINFAHS